MAQLVASMYGVVLGGVAKVVGSSLTRGKIFTASIGSIIYLKPKVTLHFELSNISNISLLLLS